MRTLLSPNVFEANALRARFRARASARLWMMLQGSDDPIRRARAYAAAARMIRTYNGTTKPISNPLRAVT